MAGHDVSTETEKPLSPLCGVCGIDDPISDEMELEEEGIISGGTEADKMGKESDDRDVRQLIDPRKPTQKEVEEHDLFHLPYRNWCAICIKAKGKELDHRSRPQTKGCEQQKG